MKSIILSILCLLCIACTRSHPPQYYKTHPHELQLMLEQKCVINTASITNNCAALMNIAQQINQLAYELQLNPQLFGQKILHLQMTLSKQIHEHIEVSVINHTQQHLDIMLAMVKWLESPGIK